MLKYTNYTLKKFEAIFVAQMMTSILPEDSEYFGEGFAGDAVSSATASNSLTMRMF